MTDDAASNSETRRARLDARRRRRGRWIWAIMAVVVIAGGATVAAFAMTENGTPAAQTPGAGQQPVDRDLPLKQASAAPPPRGLSHDQPLRLWVGGDSLAGLLGPALGDQVGATGVVSTLIDYKVSSGLWSNDLRNWSSRATSQMASDNPEAVIFFIGANDTPMPNKVDNDADGVPDWDPIYRAKVAQMMDTFIGQDPKRVVLWLGSPTMKMDSLDRGAVELNRVMKEEADKRAPNVVYVDAYKLFAGADGGYADDIVDDQGDEIRARISDGVHFTNDGAEYLARSVFKLLDAHWHMTRQADPSHPIEWKIAEGSGEAVPGANTTRTPNVRRHRTTPGTQTVASSTPDTAAPTTVVTSPPTTAAPPPPEPTTVPPTTAPPPTSTPSP
jgi:hypothetical protein